MADKDDPRHDVVTLPLLQQRQGAVEPRALDVVDHRDWVSA
jgi:hypothetical protein